MDRKKQYVRNEDKIKAFGNKLRSIRHEKGMSMQELADMSNVEYSQISRIELGVINTSLSNVFAIAEALKIPVMDFFEGLG